MCYNLKSSIVAFSIAMITVAFMYLRQTKLDKLLAPLIFTYGFMQFSEALMWYDTKCGKINKFATYLAYFVLVVQLLSTGIGLYLSDKTKLGIYLGFIVLIYYIITMPTIGCSKKSTKNIHMLWGFRYYHTKHIWPLIVLYILFLSNIKKIYKFIVLFWMAFTYLYFYSKQLNPKLVFIKRYFDISKTTIGSTWCHFASISAPLLYFIQNYI